MSSNHKAREHDQNKVVDGPRNIEKERDEEITISLCMFRTLEHHRYHTHLTRQQGCDIVVYPTEDASSQFYVSQLILGLVLSRIGPRMASEPFHRMHKMNIGRGKVMLEGRREIWRQRQGSKDSST